MPRRKNGNCGMNTSAVTLTVFADKLPLDIIFWISTVQQQSWLLNWMVLSITKQMEKFMMQNGQLI